MTGCSRKDNQYGNSSRNEERTIRGRRDGFCSSSSFQRRGGICSSFLDIVIQRFLRVIEQTARPKTSAAASRESRGREAREDLQLRPHAGKAKVFGDDV